MKIHEYQAKQILREAGVAVPQGRAADSPTAAAEAFADLGGKTAVLKAQIHAGGRGKGEVADVPGQHGVQLVHSPQEAEKVAGNLLGRRLVTVQTGPPGRTVRHLLVEEGCAVAREFYLAAIIDRTVEKPVLLASSQGGMEIEQVAATSPDSLHSEPFDPDGGLRPYQVRKVAWRLGLPRTACAGPRSLWRESAASSFNTIAVSWKSTPWC